MSNRMAKPIDVASRLKYLRERTGRSMDDVARSLGYKGASSYQRYEDATKFTKKYLPLDLTEKLVFVLRGRGNPPVTEADVMALAGPEQWAKPTFEATRVPLVTWVSAGAFALEDAQQEAIGEITETGLDLKGDWIALTVEGDSMDRISPPGSVIFVNRQDKKLVPNACYVISNGDSQVTYKRFRPNPLRFEPVSTNANHEPFFFEDMPAIVGRVKKTILEM